MELLPATKVFFGNLMNVYLYIVLYFGNKLYKYVQDASTQRIYLGDAMEPDHQLRGHCTNIMKPSCPSTHCWSRPRSVISATRTFNYSRHKYRGSHIGASLKYRVNMQPEARWGNRRPEQYLGKRTNYTCTTPTGLTMAHTRWEYRIS